MTLICQPGFCCQMLLQRVLLSPEPSTASLIQQTAAADIWQLQLLDGQLL